MRLTKQTGHAIRILVDCARAEGTLIKVADLAAHLDITPQNAFKIVHLLSRAGFVQCTRGPAGGVKLAREAGGIRIGDVVRAMEATNVAIDRDIDRSRGGAGHSRARDTAVNAVFSDALAAFITVLDQHTLAELAAAQGRESAAGASAKTARTKGSTSSKPGKAAARMGNPRRVGRRGV